MLESKPFRFLKLEKGLFFDHFNQEKATGVGPIYQKNYRVEIYRQFSSMIKIRGVKINQVNKNNPVITRKLIQMFTPERIIVHDRVEIIKLVMRMNPI
jgi:hypothetical protein